MTYQTQSGSDTGPHKSSIVIVWYNFEFFFYKSGSGKVKR